MKLTVSIIQRSVYKSIKSRVDIARGSRQSHKLKLNFDAVLLRQICQTTHL